MPYGIVHYVPGTKEQCEASLAAVHPSRDKLSQGQIYHAAGPSASARKITSIT